MIEKRLTDLNEIDGQKKKKKKKQKSKKQFCTFNKKTFR